MFPAKKLCALTVLALVILANGLHLPLIQGLAWTNMALENPEEVQFTAALQHAVEKQEMCGICVYVADQQEASGEIEASFWKSISNMLLLITCVASLNLKPGRSWQLIPLMVKRLWGRNLDTFLPPPKYSLA